MAPSRSGHDLTVPGRGGPTADRLAAYCGLDGGGDALHGLFDVVNLLPEWPGRAGSEKWDASPDPGDWGVGSRATLLMADARERPRQLVVGLGGFVAEALTEWWGLERRGYLEPLQWGATPVVWSPHPAGTNMWWNDNRARGEAFWQSARLVAEADRPLPPRKVKLGERSKWLADLSARFGGGWPDACVDWPWAEPPGRPQAYHRGLSMPAAQIVLELSGQPRPSADHQALHSCDRGPEGCVNLRHLRWGTELENRMDQVERGRGTIGRVGLAQAREIEARHRRFVRETAREFGCSESAVLGIALGKSWDPARWVRPIKETR